jgi:hypothetical protein
LCPTCSYDPRTGDTAINPPRAAEPASGPSTLSIVVSGLTMLLAIVLVVVAAVYAVREYAIERPGATRTFATESGGATGSR